MKVHVLNHHFWPDGSPSAVLEEELADTLAELGHEVVLVAGSGSFHQSERRAPKSPIIRLDSGETGQRNSQFAIVRDYWRFWRAATGYIRRAVGPTDALVATSSPFVSVFLIGALRRHARGARTVFHLHDYLPSNLRSLSPFHRALAPIVRLMTDSYLRRWGMVLVCAGNIAYHNANAAVARFWPTVEKLPGREVDRSRKTAVYAGNLGIAHDMQSLADEMERLHKQGWQIDFYGDGPMVERLPVYVDRHAFVSGRAYLDVLYTHAVHLIAGVRGDGTGAFPSKTLNSLFVGAEVRPCGFRPEMLQELDLLRQVPDLAANREVAARLVDEFVRTGCVFERPRACRQANSSADETGGDFSGQEPRP